MLDITFVRENKQKVKDGVAAKQLDPKIVDEVLSLDEKRRKLIGQIEELRAKRNKAAGEKDIAAGKAIKEELKDKEPELTKIEAEYKKTLSEIPNLPAEDVKEGKDERENEVVRKWGEVKKHGFTPKDHLALGEALGIIDIERASKVSGARFAYLKGDAVRLEFALIQFALETLCAQGFIPVVPPVLIKKDMMGGMGYLEHGGEEDMYVFDKDGLVLVGTSEQSLGPMHAGEVFDGKTLPARYVGFSSCFRRESGSYGKDTRGILRVHQFDKVEMFSFILPEDSDKEHEYLLGLEEKFLQALEIPYQVVKMCSGDLGAPAARKYDLEAWMPGQDTYREVTSTSTTTDYQARRLNIKYKEGDKGGYVHTLNGTAFAIGRTIIAILENYQEKDGSVVVPEVLRKWVGKDKITA
ncbi:MAG TPA: serine--tRNA ligase [Patescibacteria group bacterium]|uniref:Serine--tRNA ligase n=1 Tax=Candidatus Woesebacteria bacterium RBG_13_46_13 TaxID=1802479 RepID=A0A1F7X6K0_9BACT|nr:MAG: serine--tRNA ligase [Candidatus Woesebacteria bacterium RBG_13_46_13]HJX59081.1 serine--tRNA ligase [Patescibacteria group bacterium]